MAVEGAGAGAWPSPSSGASSGEAARLAASWSRAGARSEEACSQKGAARGGKIKPQKHLGLKSMVLCTGGDGDGEKRFTGILGSRGGESGSW